MTASRGRATLLVLASITSVQLGGALAVTLLPRVGVAGSVALRLGVAALVLLLMSRPRLRGHSAGDWAVVVSFGAALALMNSTFYASLTRLPIGLAVTVEFVGPLLLAAATSRRVLDIGAVLLAASGIALISGVVGPVHGLDPVGVLLALAAGAAWAAYIILSARTGTRFDGLDGLAIAMTVAAVLVTPVGAAVAGGALLSPDVLLRGAGIALLSSVLPYSLELAALRTLPPRVFGVLLSLEPAAAALAGLLVLGQRLAPLQVFGMAAVVLASAAVTFTGDRRNPPAAD